MALTGQEVCQLWVNYERKLKKLPLLTGMDLYTEARKFWELDRHGGLTHVWDAFYILQEAGEIPRAHKGIHSLKKL